MKLRLLLASITIIFNLQLHAQGVAVNNSGQQADSSAIFDVSSSDKGMLVPRLTNAQRNAISNPADGLLIFNTTTNCFNFYRAGLWFELCGNCVMPYVPVVSSNSPVCEGDTLKLFANFIPNATYSWTGPNGFSSTQQNPVISNAAVAGTGTYQLVVSSPGCTSQPVSTQAVVNPIPSASFTNLPNPGMVNQNVSFFATTPGAFYSWTFQGASPPTSSLQNPVVLWSSTGSYNVSLSVNLNGCTASSSSTISVVSCAPGTTTFNYTGSVQSWTVPSCVSVITVDAKGAQGGGSNGGQGGRAQANIPVTPGETLLIYVGGKPTQQWGANSGGWNGGGNLLALPCGGGSDGWPGGGASDIRRTSSLSTRLIVAGGGGGQGYSNGLGGYGGGLSGNDGAASWISGTNGKGGTQIAGGAGGYYSGNGQSASNGVLGIGGDAGPVNTYCIGGGGGGGYYGGGGGYVSAGGGGSSWVAYPGSTNTSTTTGYQYGNGQIVISW